MLSKYSELSRLRLLKYVMSDLYVAGQQFNTVGLENWSYFLSESDRIYFFDAFWLELEYSTNSTEQNTDLPGQLR